MGTFGDSWALTKTAFRTIREDKALLLFPLVSGLCAIGIIAMFAVGLFTMFFYTNLASNPNTFQAVVGLLFLLVYFLLWIVSVYFQGALIGAATMKLNGGQPTFSDGMKEARAHAGKLIAWALIGATIMLVIRAIASRMRGIVGVVFQVGAGLAIGALTYFLIPVLMYEQQSAWGSLKRSASLFAKTFGRTFLSNLALGLILALGFLLGFVLLIVGAILLFGGSVIPGLILALAGLAMIVFMVILASAAEGVLTAALYRFATTGQVAPGLIHPQYLAGNPQAAAASAGRPLRSNAETWGAGPPPPPPTLPPMAQP